MDVVQIRNLGLKCIIGVRPHERRREQKIFVNVDCFCDLEYERIRDELNRTLDYGRLAAQIEEFVTGSSFQLIETLAEKIADLCLKEELVRKVVVEVVKPRALRRAEAAVVRLIRERETDKIG
jgi:FolB domain-containing protein